MTSLLTLISRTSRHKKLLFQSNIKNMKMTHTRAFTSHPFEFSVSSVIDFVFSPAMCFPIGYPPSTIAAHIRWLFTPSSFIFSCVPPSPPQFSMRQTLRSFWPHLQDVLHFSKWRAGDSSCSQGVSYSILSLKYLNTFKGQLIRRSNLSKGLAELFTRLRSHRREGCKISPEGVEFWGTLIYLYIYCESWWNEMKLEHLTVLSKWQGNKSKLLPYEKVGEVVVFFRGINQGFWSYQLTKYF